MDRTRLVDGRLARLNRGLLAFRLGLYGAVAAGLVTSQAGGMVTSEAEGIGPAAAVLAAAIVIALPIPGLAGRRIEVGIAISLTVHAVLWPMVGAVPALELLPLFATLVAGLLLSRRSALVVTGTAVVVQVSHLAMWWNGLTSVDTTGFAFAGRTALVLVVGLGFLEIGSVLRDYQSKVVAQSLEELRLTELIDEKDRLIDKVAHELRTPLTAVLGLSSELAGGSVGADEVPMLAGVVAGEARRLAGTIDNLVVAARSDIDRLGSTPEPVDVADLVLRCWRLVSGGEDGCLVSGDGVALADERRLAHVLVNLFDNVIRHGDIPVLVRVDAREDGLTVTVTDAGSGIPDGEDVFDRYRAGGDSSRPDNLGLGLPVARTLARLMGGDLRVADGAVALDLPVPALVEVGG